MLYNQESQHSTRSKQNSQISEELVDAQWIALCEKIKSSINAPDPQKEQILRRRILMNFNECLLGPTRHFVSRREVKDSANPFLTVSSDTILLYGVDYMDEKRVKSYFEINDIQVEYYDDSHCHVKFHSFSTAIASLQKKAVKNTKIQSDDFRDKPTERMLWVQLMPYAELLGERKLWARFLSNQDVKQKKSKQMISYRQGYLNAKKKFIGDYQNIDERRKGKRFSRESRSRSRQNKFQFNQQIDDEGDKWSSYKRQGNRSRERMFQEGRRWHHCHCDGYVRKKDFFRNSEDRQRFENHFYFGNQSYGDRVQKVYYQHQPRAGKYGRQSEHLELRRQKMLDEEFDRYNQMRVNEGSMKDCSQTTIIRTKDSVEEGEEDKDMTINELIKEMEASNLGVEEGKMNEEEEINVFESYMRNLKLNSTEYSVFDVDEDVL